jgi:hypothetical protein
LVRELDDNRGSPGAQCNSPIGKAIAMFELTILGGTTQLIARRGIIIPSPSGIARPMTNYDLLVLLFILTAVIALLLMPPGPGTPLRKRINEAR